MKLYDSVDLNCELDDLAQRGIHKDCRGRIIEQTPYSCSVVFFNPSYYGDYACAEVNKEYLTLAHTNNSRTNAEFAEWVNKTDVKKKTQFKPVLFREYDKVELIVEKSKYSKRGVHKGMAGAITEPYSIDGCWNVIFTGSDGYDIAELEVNEEDIILLQR